MKLPRYVKAEPQKVFAQAEYFQEATSILVDKQKDKSFLVIPVGTLSSFALELYLKSLLAIENANSEFPAIHELDDLYDLLSAESKQIIEFIFPSFARFDVVLMQRRAENKNVLIPPSEEIANILKESRGAFEGFRYAFDLQNPKLPETHSIWAVRQAVRMRIVGLRPAWDVPTTVNKITAITVNQQMIKSLMTVPKNRHSVGVGIKCPICSYETRVQFNFKKNNPVAPGFVVYPKNMILTCTCNEKLYLKEMRLAVEKVFGKKVV